MKRFPLLIGAVAAFALGCYTGPGADHFVAIVDELDVPDKWEIAKTIVRGPDQPDACHPGLNTECPGAIRYFSAGDDLDEAYARAKDAVAATGFGITDENTFGCSSGSATGPPCGFFAKRGTDHLYAGVYASATEASIDVADGDGVIVMVRVAGEGK